MWRDITRGLSYLAIVPIIVFAGLIIVLLWLGVYEPVFQPPYSILVLNTLFLTGSSLVVAWISSRSYLNGAPSNILLLGCAFLINGIAAVVAGWFFSFSANYTVTIYNSCTLLSSILQLANVAFSSQSLDSKSKKTDLKLKLASGYIASVAVVILVSALAYYGFAPKFFINNSGATFVDISVLATTILFFAMSSLLLMRRQLKSKFPALFWYSLGLALFAIGLLGVSFEKSLGDPIGWIGKIAQYVGGLYFLIAVIKARGKAESTDASYSDRWAESFRSDRKQVATLFSNMLDGVVYAKIITDAIGKPVDYVYLDVNDAYERIFSVKKETILGKRVTEVFPDITKDPTKWIDIVGHVAVTGQPTTFENYAQFQNKWIHASLYSPQKGYSVAIFEDITERKKAETEREIMVEFLRIANATNGTRDLVKAATGFFQKQSGCEAVGVRLKEGDDYPYYETRGFPPEHVQLENKLCASDEAGYVIRDSKGEPVLECMCGNVICGRFDPSKKFFTESGSFWTNSTTQLLANTTSADRQGNTRNRCNSEGYESVALIVLRVGDTRLGLLQLNDKRKDMFTLETIQMWERIADRLALALSKTIAEEALRKSELQYRGLSEHLEALVEERTKQLKDSERLATIGATAGMVGHDIRNPLQAITGDVYLAKTELASTPESDEKKNVLESLQEIEKNTDYINKIVADLQDFARPLKPNAEESDLKLIIDELLKKNGLQENVKVSVKVESDARKVVADSTFINRIMYNLVTNAVQAMPKGGKLTIHAYKEANDVLITVKDTGVGIPEAVKGKLFTPMFTTKAKGQGFGLAVIKRMTESLGGTVTFESQEGKGTTFMVRLPPPQAINGKWAFK